MEPLDQQDQREPTGHRLVSMRSCQRTCQETFSTDRIVACREVLVTKVIKEERAHQDPREEMVIQETGEQMEFQ